MSNRLFQTIIHQMKDVFNRTIGVIDENGIIIASSDLSKIGEGRQRIREELSFVQEGVVFEGYTYRYDFESVPSTNETFNPNIVIPTEDRSSASESLDICLDLLSCIFGKEEVRKAINKTEI